MEKAIEFINLQINETSRLHVEMTAAYNSNKLGLYTQLEKEWTAASEKLRGMVQVLNCLTEKQYKPTPNGLKEIEV